MFKDLPTAHISQALQHTGIAEKLSKQNMAWNLPSRGSRCADRLIEADGQMWKKGLTWGFA
jgi:hypothetical protein